MDRFEILKKEYRIMLLSGLPMVGSLFVYWMLIQFVIHPPQTPQETAAPLRYMLYFIAAGGVGAIFFLRRVLLQKKPQDNLAALIGKLKTSAMVTLAFCEAPALYGVVLYFIEGSRKDFYVLAVYSLLLFAVFFPRLDHWQEYTAGAAE